MPCTPGPGGVAAEQIYNPFTGVEYMLLVHVDEPARRPAILSALHAQIQDAFNEYGVQIMSPHFVLQPDGAVVVPKGKWFAAPAKPES